MVTPTKSSSRNSVGFFKAPLPISEINDDEHERQQRRSNVSANNSIRFATPSGIIDDNEDLKNCLELFQQNKINKSNVWTTPIIDTLMGLVHGHRKYVRNFQVVGASIEASSKIYSIRVDYVHDEAVRMSSGLTRMEDVKSKNKDQKKTTEEDDGADIGSGDDMEQPTKPKPKKPKVKHTSSAVTQNKDTINAKLETVPFLDPVFADLKNSIGDVASSNRAFINNLETKHSEMLLECTGKYWEKSDTDEPDMTDDKDLKIFAVRMDVLKEEPIQFRNIFRGYQFTDRPCDINKMFDDSDSDHDEMSNNDEPVKMNASAIGLQFDINAEVEPVEETRHLMDLEVADFDDNFTEEDENALLSCKNLQRPTIVIESLEPNDSSKRRLEYSYRQLSDITKFWAGPSYWRFKPSMNRMTRFNEDSGETTGMKAPKQRAKRRAKIFAPIKADEADMSQIISINLKKKLKLIMKNWDPKKLKLPTNYHMPDYIFETIEFAPGYKMRMDGPIEEETLQVEIINSAENAGNTSHSSNSGICLPTDLGMPATECADNPFNLSHHDDDHHDDNEYVNPNITADMNTQSSSFQGYGSECLGAPEKVEKIILPFAMRAKIVDMKQLKTASWNSLENRISKQKLNELKDEDKENLKQKTKHLAKKNENYEIGNTTFLETFTDLPTFIHSKTLEENLSVPLVFSAVLHLANERDLRFVPTDPPFDFKIIKISHS